MLGACLSGADVTRANFVDTLMIGLDFSKATIDGWVLSVRDNDLTGANLSYLGILDVFFCPPPLSRVLE